LIPVSRFVEKGFLGKHRIKFSHLIMVSQFLYETGAIIGRARRDKLQILGKMLAVPGKETEFTSWLQELSQNRLTNYGKEPDTFFSFIWNTELAKAGLKMDWSKEFVKACDQKIPTDAAEPIIKSLGLEGIGFGSKFPSLTEKMLKQQYESDKSDTIAEMRKYGAKIDERSLHVALIDREKEILTALGIYVNEYFPELLKSLELKVD